MSVFHHHDPHRLDGPNTGKAQDTIKTAGVFPGVGIGKDGVGDAVGCHHRPVDQIGGAKNYVTRAWGIRDARLKLAVGVLRRNDSKLPAAQRPGGQRAKETQQSRSRGAWIEHAPNIAPKNLAGKERKQTTARPN